MLIFLGGYLVLKNIFSGLLKSFLYGSFFFVHNGNVSYFYIKNSIDNGV